MLNPAGFSANGQVDHMLLSLRPRKEVASLLFRKAGYKPIDQADQGSTWQVRVATLCITDRQLLARIIWTRCRYSILCDRGNTSSHRPSPNMGSVLLSCLLLLQLVATMQTKIRCF